MSTVAFIKRMRERGWTWEQCLEAAEEFEATSPVYTPAKPDSAAERKRQRDRDRMARLREEERQSRDVAAMSPKSRDVAEVASDRSDVAPEPRARVEDITPKLVNPGVITPLDTPSGCSPRKAKSTLKPSRRCPEGWAPSQRCRQQLAGEGFESGDLERALTRMRDHEFKTARTDWDATYRNWVREDRDRNPRQAHDRHHDHAPSARQENLRAMHAGALAALNRRER